MGLVNCGECGRSVSGSSTECYNCGNPIVAPEKVHASGGYQVEMVKKLKVHSTVSIGVVAACMVWIILLLDKQSIEALFMPAALLIPAVLWFIFTKCRIWSLHD